jgi:hypothetical protein
MIRTTGSRRIMNMKTSHLPTRLAPILLGLLSCSAPGAVLLSGFHLGGTQETVTWETTLTPEGQIATGGALSSSNPSGTPTTGTGTIAPGGGGFRASSGFYSFMSNYHLTATIAVQDVVALPDIQNVVFQRVSIANPDLTLEENLGIGGGPVLSYFDGTQTLTLAASHAATGASLTSGEGSTAGTYHSFIYQWDLSSIAENITSVSIHSPIPIHASTVEARIDIADGFIQVVPEPSALLLSIFGFSVLMKRRR